MKKFPLLFILFFMSCSVPEKITANRPDFTKHPQPYHIFTVGKWNDEYVILTVTDARNNYFTFKTAYNTVYKRGAVYTP